MNNQKLSMQKTAFIAIVGKPNVGKSSILNRLIGQKIAIVSHKPQTTRTRIMGVLTKDDCQYVFLDTPGLIKPKNSLGEYMVKAVNASISGVDGGLLVVEANQPISKADEDLLSRFRAMGLPAVLAINKIDQLSDKGALMSQISLYANRFPFAAVVPVSARTGSGMDALLNEIHGIAREGEFLFPEDALTDQPERVIAAETVREKLLRLLDKEVPHGVAAVTERMKERDGLIDIEVIIYCERAKHKGIIIGKNGSMLKQVGIDARHDLEKFFQCKVNLQLWVKVKEDWRQRGNLLHSLGFDEKSLLE